MIRKIKYRRLVKGGKQGFKLSIPKWVPQALLFDVGDDKRIDICLVWDDERPNEVSIRRANLTEINIQADHEQDLGAQYLAGTLDPKATEEGNRLFLEHLVWSEEEPQLEPVKSGVNGLSRTEASYFARLPKGEFCLNTFKKLGAPVGTGQRVLAKLMNLKLIQLSREERTGGKGRPRKWYVKTQMEVKEIETESSELEVVPQEVKVSKMELPSGYMSPELAKMMKEAVDK